MVYDSEAVSSFFLSEWLDSPWLHEGVSPPLSIRMVGWSMTPWGSIPPSVYRNGWIVHDYMSEYPPLCLSEWLDSPWLHEVVSPPLSIRMVGWSMTPPPGLVGTLPQFGRNCIKMGIQYVVCAYSRVSHRGNRREGGYLFIYLVVLYSNFLAKIIFNII